MRTVHVADLKATIRNDVRDAIEQGRREVLVSWEDLADIVMTDEEDE